MNNIQATQAIKQLMMAEEIKAEAVVVAATPLTVETIDNHIFFYSDVNEDRVLALIQSLSNLDNRLRLEAIERDRKSDPIWLHINSYGGYMSDGYAAADAIAAMKTPVNIIVEGMAASAAVGLVLSGAKRYITPKSYMMIHEFSQVVWGKYKDFKDDMVLQDMLWKQLVAFYAKHTKLSKSKLRKMLKHNFWMDAAQAVEYGFVDEILT